MTESYRIGVDARPFIHVSNGNARYLHQMLSYLTKERRDIEWILFSHRPLHQEYAGLVSRPGVVLEVDRSWKNMAGPIWMNLSIPEMVRRFEVDLFWGTLAMLPVKKLPVPAAVNFHDLNSMVAPHSMSFANRMQHRALDHNTLRNADRVICLSDTTRQDIQRFFPDISAGRMEVVYPGADWDESVSAARPARLPATLQSGSFYFSLGTIEPRKNFATLIQAYREARTSRDSIPDLLIAGKQGWGSPELYEQLRSGKLAAEGIHFLEGPGDGEIRWLFENCHTFLLPSVHEGFGLPIIEAFAAGKPAILSDISVFREIGGHARYCGVDSVEDWKLALLEGVPGRKSGMEFDINEWTWQNRARKLGSLFGSLLSGV